MNLQSFVNSKRSEKPYMHPLLRLIAAEPSRRAVKPLHRLIFGRPFSDQTPQRLLVLFEPNRISFASIFPFIVYASRFQKRFGVEIRCINIEGVLERGVPRSLASADRVLAQTWLTDPPERQHKAAKLLREFSESGRTVAYLDSFANADLRLIGRFDTVDLYYKKSLFVDRARFLEPTYGHTNLSEFYGQLYGMSDVIIDWKVPPETLSKLRVAPNFLTDPRLSELILAASEVDQSPRRIDLHARFGGTEAQGWYGEMRRHAAKVVDNLRGVRAATGGGLNRGMFMNELRQSKVCFSPFGYGELCWRDIEAISAGAVLIKPDMSHLCTEPDLYRDGETYIACRWDFADFADKLDEILRDNDRRRYIATNALKIAKNYLESFGPVEAYAGLFESVKRPPK